MGLAVPEKSFRRCPPFSHPQVSRFMVPIRIIPCLVLLGTLLWPVAGCRQESDPATGQLVGAAVPPLQLVPLNRGGPAPELVGRLTLLNFWGTWCPPCRRELPGLVRLAERLEGEPRFQLLAVSCGGGGRDDVDQLREQTAAFLESADLALDAWADPSGATRQAFADQLGFSAYPTSYLIGPDSRVLAVWRGYSATVEAEIARAVAATLSRMPPAAQPAAAATAD